MIMFIREPVAAGHFYKASSEELERQINELMCQGKEGAPVKKAWAVMLPHAGYVYCGDIIGKTLAGVELPSTLIIFCPNHTGLGKALGVWPDGMWLTPLGAVKVNEALAEKIMAAGAGFQADAMSHAREHSIEVLLPFLQRKVKNLSIVPVCVGVQNPRILRNAARGLANVIKDYSGDIGLVVSSDMNHYENEEMTLAKDQLALDAILANMPDALLRTVREKNISMCGAAPMALALYTAMDLGKVKPVLVAHGTSAQASGDYNHTVGYAGMEFMLEPAV